MFNRKKKEADAFYVMKHRLKKLLTELEKVKNDSELSKDLIACNLVAIRIKDILNNK